MRLIDGFSLALAIGLGMALRSVRNLRRSITRVGAGERSFRQMFADNPSIQMLMDPVSGAIIEANQAASDFYGYAHEELLQRHVSDLNPLLTYAAACARLAAMAAEGRTSFVSRHRLASGEMRDVDVKSSPFDDAHGSVVLYIIVNDVTERTRAEAALGASETRYRLMFEENRATQLVIDLQSGAIVDANPAACAFYGYSRETMLDMHMRDISALSGNELASREQGRTSFVASHRLATGELRDVEVHTSLNRSGQRPLIYAIVHDITERKKASTALAHQALHDELTGLANRGLLHTRLEDTLRLEHADGRSTALLLLDLDRFKEVNDTLGHQVGDVLLQQIGQRLESVALPTDLVARLGGDEFAMLLPETDVSRATAVADAVVHVLQAPFLLDGQPIAVDVSIGIALAPLHGQNADTLLRCADVAMYQAKRSGAGIAQYNPADDEHRPDRLALLGELRSAIDHDELLLYYQPKLDLRTGALVGVEALVRWQHPQRGFLPPSEFIPLAEQTGLIHPLSRWILEAALKQHQLWNVSKLGINVPVSVNLSRRNLHDPQLPDTVAHLLARWDVAPEALILEITESSLMADPVRAGENLERLRSMGVRMSIDDFGIGYSSLASLKNLSVYELKIDQSFVQAMATDASSRAIVRAIIDLADALKLGVVAEGVEDRATWDVLAGLGCDVAQGYFLSRPMPASELEAWVAQAGPSWLAIAESSQVDDALQERILGRGARLTAEEEFVARKHAEAALRESEERTRLALQAAGMGTWAWDVATDVHTWSPETEALYGLAPGTFEGTFAAFKRTVHPDDWAKLNDDMQAGVAEHRELTCNFRTLWPDGTVHWLENRGRASYAPDGSLAGVTGTSIDISRRKEDEHQREVAAHLEKRDALSLMATAIARNLNQSLMLVASIGDPAHHPAGQDAPDLAELDALLTRTSQAASDWADAA